ncbi:hypothetical protein H7170_01925 [Candidatus Gracilibacteria bacterium]|nr:hypothetical protein [Candidatus Gracilibacteria bacterium]
MSFIPLHLADREKNPDYHDKSRDMETALVWNAVQKTLINMSRLELIPYVKSVKLGERTIVITTTKPIANAELRIYSEQILSNANESLERIGSIKREKIMWK